MTREHKLARLFERMFSASELYTFLRHHAGKGLVNDLPNPATAGRAPYAAQAAEKLLERGLLTPSLVDAWAEARPGRAAELAPFRTIGPAQPTMGHTEEHNAAQQAHVLSFKHLVEQQLIAELANLFHDEASAMTLLTVAEIPLNKLRPFAAMTPEQYWTHVCQQLDRGIAPSRQRDDGSKETGLDRLMAAAAEHFPGSARLQPYRAKK